MFAKRYFAGRYFTSSFFPAGVAAAVAEAVAGAATPVFVRDFDPNVNDIHKARQMLQRIQAWLRDVEGRVRVLEESLTLEAMLAAGPDGKGFLAAEGVELRVNVATWRAWVNRKLMTHEQALAPRMLLTRHDGDYLITHEDRRICVSPGAYAARLDARLTTGGH